MRSDDPFEEFEIDLAPIWPPDDARLEPIFMAGPLWFEFDEVAEFEPLDPDRTLAEPNQAPAPRERALAIGLLGSLGIHLLPLLMLIGWSATQAEMPAPIPVQLVVEEPPPEHAPDETKPPSGQPVPETETTSEKPSEKAAAATSVRPAPPAPRPPPPPPPKVAAVVPRPRKPTPPPEPAPPQPAAAVPKPIPPKLPTPKEAAPPLPSSRPPPMPNPAPHEAPVSGPEQARRDYFAYLVALTRRHFDLLPPSFIAGRRGETVLSILVLGDGTVAHIDVVQSSGYPDIDARIKQMVAAVGRFPPLPQNVKSPSVELDFKMLFPEALER